MEPDTDEHERIRAGLAALEMEHQRATDWERQARGTLWATPSPDPLVPDLPAQEARHHAAWVEAEAAEAARKTLEVALEAVEAVLALYPREPEEAGL